MAAASDQMNRPAENEDDIILLTDVVEEPSGEVVLEIAPAEEDLDFLFLKEPAPPPSPPAPAAAAEDESLDDLLASLEDLPEDLGTPPPLPPAAAPLEEAPVAPAGLEEAVRRELEAFLTEDRLKEIVREVIQERVDNLSRDLLPQVAAETMDRKIAALLKRLAEGE
jgi:hypothetical protein